jgi:hypothetical protein
MAGGQVEQPIPLSIVKLAGSQVAVIRLLFLLEPSTGALF